MLLYRTLVSLSLPAVALIGLWRVAKGQDDWRAYRERLGFCRPPRRRQPRIWLHAASNGELTSVRPIVEALASAMPNVGFLVTSNTLTGRALVESWPTRNIEARVAPIDTRAAVRRLVRDFELRGHLIVESEIWPNRILAISGAGLPIAVIGARLSERSARNWSRWAPQLMRRILERIDWVSPQDRQSSRRFSELGLPSDRIGPVLQLKALYRPRTRVAPPELSRLFDRSSTWLAASTHEGEDEQILDAHLEARRHRRGLSLILAPRHPHRSTEIAALLAARGLSFARFSDGIPATRPEVLLADTLGEMDYWYALSAAVFVGGSLVDKGGHTPFEPIAHECAIVHGPSTANFQEPYDALDDGRGALAVRDTRELGRALVALGNEEQREKLTRNATDIAARFFPTGDVARSLVDLFAK